MCIRTGLEIRALACSAWHICAAIAWQISAECFVAAATESGDDDALRGQRPDESRGSMPILVAVWDPLPIYRRGMLATLSAAGFAVETAADLLDWAQQEHRLVVMLTLSTPADWAVLERLREERPAVLVVAVLPDADAQSYVRAVAAGATSAVPRDAAPEAVRRVVEDVLRGVSSLPAEAMAALAAPHERPTHVPEPSPPELDWLRELAVGATVAQLAERSGYSERAMFRLLRELYARLGVRNRTEALMLAQRRGWL